MKCRVPWSPEELAALRALYARPKAKRTRARFRKALPGRTLRSIYVKAAKLSLGRSGRAWTAAEDRALRSAWIDSAVRTIRKALPGRSWVSIYRRAMALSLGPRFAGYVTMSEAVTRCGCNPEIVRAACRAAGVSWQRVGGRDEQGGAARMMADWDNVRDAVTAWTRLETQWNAARRHGVSHHTMRHRLQAAGVIGPGAKGVPRRLDPDVVDRVMAAKPRRAA